MTRTHFFLLLLMACVGYMAGGCSNRDDQPPGGTRGDQQMEQNLPHDADGDAIRRLARDGSDLSKPMYIDFQVAVPDEASANDLAQAAKKLGYRVAVYESSECSLPWTCECSTRMLATHSGVCAIQRELAELAKAFGGYPDGWGSFGNMPGK